MEPVEYLRGLRRRWKVIVAAILIGATAAWLTTAATASHPNGNAVHFQASVLVLDARGTQFGSESRSAEGVSLNTVAALVTLDQVAERAAHELKSHIDPGKLASHVTATADTDTGILTITATASSGRRAEKVADAFAQGLRSYLNDQRKQALQQQIRALQQQIDALPEGGGRGNDSSLRLSLQSQLSGLRSKLAAPLGLPILERSHARRVEQTGLAAPSSLPARVLIGAVVGLLGGIGLALVLERFDRRINTWRIAGGLLDAPLLAEIPRLRRPRGLAVVDHPISPGADAFRLLASTVLHMIHEQSVVAVQGNGHGEHPSTPMLAITSAVRGEGKSVVAANLAAALGELGIRSILISCDLRSPTVHRFFGLPIAPGITDAMYAWDGRLGFRRILTSTRAPNVSLISGGSPSSRPASILASNDLHNLLRYAREEAQIVILDTPAILLSGDAVSQIQDADAVLLVARLGKTTLEAAERVGVTLERLGAHVIGHALNGSRSVRSHWRRTAYRVAKGSPVTVVPDLAPARTPGEA